MLIQDMSLEKIVKKFETGELDKVEVYNWNDARDLILQCVIHGQKIVIQESPDTPAFLIGIIRKRI